MHDENISQRVGWGQGWHASQERIKYQIKAELTMVEARLRLNREDFDEGHPCVIMAEEHRKSLLRLAASVDIKIGD